MRPNPPQSVVTAHPAPSPRLQWRAWTRPPAGQRCVRWSLPAQCSCTAASCCSRSRGRDRQARLLGRRCARQQQAWRWRVQKTRRNTLDRSWHEVLRCPRQVQQQQAVDVRCSGRQRQRPRRTAPYQQASLRTGLDIRGCMGGVSVPCAALCLVPHAALHYAWPLMLRCP